MTCKLAFMFQWVEMCWVFKLHISRYLELLKALRGHVLRHCGGTVWQWCWHHKTTHQEPNSGHRLDPSVKQRSLIYLTLTNAVRYCLAKLLYVLPQSRLNQTPSANLSNNNHFSSRIEWRPLVCCYALITWLGSEADLCNRCEISHYGETPQDSLSSGVKQNISVGNHTWGDWCDDPDACRTFVTGAPATADHLSWSELVCVCGSHAALAPRETSDKKLKTRLYWFLLRCPHFDNILH